MYTSGSILPLQICHQLGLSTLHMNRQRKHTNDGIGCKYGINDR